MQCLMQTAQKIEMSFAHLKRIHGLGRLRLRGLCGAHDEFILAATAQNLKKLAKLAPCQNHFGKAA
ncbi:transposase [Pseudopelagicola sp. nBUS_19]|uniref:transposase n=1 Tax=Pseudopelagicola sp. nBUS_19 TaxID=3395316 RepID=UPI003EC06FED